MSPHVGAVQCWISQGRADGLHTDLLGVWVAKWGGARPRGGSWWWKATWALAPLCRGSGLHWQPPPQLCCLCCAKPIGYWVLKGAPNWAKASGTQPPSSQQPEGVGKVQRKTAPPPHRSSGFLLRNMSNQGPEAGPSAGAAAVPRSALAKYGRRGASGQVLLGTPSSLTRCLPHTLTCCGRNTGRGGS